METITQSKQKISYEDFLDQCDEDILSEWVDGEIIMVPSASERHQDICGFLLSILRFYTESQKLGRIFGNPYQMKLELSGREPDILYVAPDHLDRIKNTYLDGPADMVIEIISRESGNRDRGEKFFEYEASGISEYWLIDPIRQQAEFYRISADSYYHIVSLDIDGIYHSETIPSFWLKVSWLWKEPLPSILEVIRGLRIL